MAHYRVIEVAQPDLPARSYWRVDRDPPEGWKPPQFLHKQDAEYYAAIVNAAEQDRT